MTTGDPPVRIGTTERAAAMKALDEHLAAGRLDVDEYADRSATAANATLATELAALFTDLPAPHPELPGAAAPPPPVAPPPAAVGWRPARFFDDWGTRLVAVVPFVAVLLFFLTRQWWWFLLIPIAGALVYGGGAGRDRSGRDGRRDRR